MRGAGKQVPGAGAGEQVQGANAGSRCRGAGAREQEWGESAGSRCGKQVLKADARSRWGEQEGGARPSSR